jgi:hypothetical protein
MSLLSSHSFDLQVGPHRQPPPRPDGQRDQELLELMDQEEDPQAGQNNDFVGEPPVQHGHGGVGCGPRPPANATVQRGGPPARCHHQPEPCPAVFETGGRPGLAADGTVASTSLSLLHVRHHQRQPAVIAVAGGSGPAPAPVLHLHVSGGHGRAELPAASAGGQHEHEYVCLGLQQQLIR